MRTFLLTCTALMVVAGIYGATDMSIDIKNGELIEYEHVRERHANHILAIIKTTGLAHTRTVPAKGKSISKESTSEARTPKKEKGIAASTGKTAVEVMEIFSRGDIDATLEPVATIEDELRAKAEAAKSISATTDTLTKVTGDVNGKLVQRK